MDENETRVVYRAIADFSQLTREARRARRELRELREEEARLNAQSAASVSNTRSQVAANNARTQSTNSHTSATSSNTRAVNENSNAIHRGAGAHRANAAAAHAANQVLGAVAQTSQRVSRTTREVADSTDRMSQGLRRGNQQGNQLRGTFGRLLPVAERINNAFDRLGKWRPSLVPPFIALIPAIVGVLSLLNPLVAGLGAVGGAAIGFASSLGRLSGAALAAVPGLFTLLTTVMALKTAFSGVGGAFNAFKTAKNAKSTGGGGGTAGGGTGIKLAELTLQEKLTRAQEAYRRSVEDVKFAQDDLNEARKDYIRRLRDLEKAVKNAGLSEMRAAANVQLAYEEYKRTLADPNASQGDRMAAEVAYKEALEEQGAVQEENKKNAEDLVEMKQKGMDGDKSVIMAQRALTDAINRSRDAQLELINVRRRDAQEAAQAASGGGGAGTWDAYREALSKLSPSARSVVEQLVAMHDAWLAVKKVVQESFFSKFVGDIQRLRDLLPAVQSLLSDTAGAAGEVVSNFLKLITSPEWRSDLVLLGEGNVPIIRNVGDGILALLDMFKDLTVIVQPFLEALTEGFKEGSENLRDLVNEARDSGSLGRWLMGDEDSRGVLDTLRQWWDIIKNIGKTIFNYSSAAREFSYWLTDAFENSTKGWLATSEEATKEGSPFKKWLEDIKPVLSEVSRLFDTFFSWFIRESADTSNIDQMVEILKIITDDLGPALARLFDNLSEAEIGPKFFDTLTKLVDIIAKLADSGATEVFFDVLNQLLDFLLAILDIPGVADVLGAIMSAFAALAAISFVAKFTGLENLIGLLLKLAKAGGLPGLVGRIMAAFGKTPPGVPARAITPAVPARAVGAPQRVMPGAAPLGATPRRAAPTFWQRLTGQAPKAAATAGSAAKSTTALAKAGTLVSKAGGFLAKGAKLATGPVGAIASIVGSLAGDAIANGAAAGSAGSGQRIGGNVLSGAATGAGIGGAVGSIVPGVGTAIGAGVGGVIGGAVGLFGSAEEDKASFFAGLGTSWNTFWGETLPTFWTDLTSGVGGWLEGVGTSWNTFWGETLPTFWTDLLAGIGTWIAGIGPAWDEFWITTFPAWIGYAVGAFAAWVVNIGESWDTFWSETWPSWLANAGLAILSWYEGIKTSWDTFWSETWPLWLANAALTITSWYEEIKTQWDTFWAETFPAWVETAKTAIVDWFNGIGPAWNDFWGTTWPKWKTDAGKAAGNLVDGLKKGWNDFWTVTLPSFGNKLRTAGSDFFGGLKEGFDRWWGGVKESFTGGFLSGWNQYRNNGGPIRRASGGGVPGHGNGDTVPAMLTPGEFVIRKAIVNRVGEENMARFNSGLMSFAELLSRVSGPKSEGGSGGTSQVSFFSGGGLVPSLPTSPGGGPGVGGGVGTSGGYGSPQGATGTTIIVEKLIIENPKQETVPQSLHSTVRKLNYVYGGSEG